MTRSAPRSRPAIDRARAMRSIFPAKRSFAQRFGLSGGGAGANAPAGLAAEAAHAAVEALETRAAWSRFGA